MPIVASFDGTNRRITLDSSVANSSWSPLNLYKEYLAYRRDNHAFRGFSPLIVMKGGEPKGGGKFAPRFLQLLTDDRGITTKFILPNTGPYRTVVDGELSTDVADTDPEPFDTSNLTTAVIIDYKPSEAEIIAAGVDSDKMNDMHKAHFNRRTRDNITGQEVIYEDDKVTIFKSFSTNKDNQSITEIDPE